LELKARIVTVLDTDLSTLFRPLVEDAKRARVQVATEMRGMGSATVSAAQEAANRQREVFQATHQLNMQVLKNKGSLDKAALAQAAKNAREETALVQKAATDRTRIEAGLAKQVTQIRATAQRDEERARSASALAAQKHAQKLAELDAKAARTPAGGSANGGHGAMVGSIASSGARAFAGSVRAGVGMAADLARGAGVNFDLSSMIGKSVGIEKSAVDLSNAGFMPGKEGPAGQRQDPAGIINDIKKAAADAALDMNKMADGLQSFVGKTGELELGRKLLGDMGKLARATGSDVGDMMNAAGDVAAQLEKAGIKEGQAEKVNVIMRAIAGQGKQGAVEIKDMATQMAKLAATAPQFAGTFEESMAGMGALAQEARQSGGAASATQAATSVMSFTNSFSKGARRSAFKAAGVEVEDKQTGKFRSAQDIIMDSLRATGGDSVKMGKLFADSGARRVTRGFESIYKANGGGEAGLAAVAAEFEKLKKATMSEAEVSDSFNASMQTAEAKAQLFQNQLQEIAGTVATRLMPALEKAAPSVLSMAEKGAEFASKLAEVDVGYIIGGALVASIGQAAIGQLVASSLQSAMSSMSGAQMGQLGAIGALTIMAVGVALYAQKVEKEDEKRQKDEQLRTDELIARNENDKNLYAVAVEDSAQKEDALQVARDEEALAKTPAEKATATKKRERAEAEYSNALVKQNQLGSNLQSSTWELKSRTDVADEMKDKPQGGLKGFGFSLGTFVNSFTGGGLSQNGTISRDDVATAKAIAASGDRAAKALADGQAALAGKTLRVQVINLPQPGVDPGGRTGNDGRKPGQ